MNRTLILRFFIFVFTVLNTALYAQSTAGITGVRDTSYNPQNEFEKQLKIYPFISLAESSPLPFIIAENNINYSKTKEKDLKLDVIFPLKKTTEKKIAILFIHGGGWRSGNKALHYPLLQTLAARGFVCISPEYRLSTEALYPAGVHDIKTAIRWVRKNADRYNIDVNKIVAAGHSAGGELAAMMGATNGMKAFEGDRDYKKYSSIVNAVIDLDGLLAFIHPESGEGDDSKRISAATNWFGYSKTENPELWKQGSPLTHVGKHSPPIQFINSGVTRMHAGREDFITILNQNNIYSEVKTFEGSPHTFIMFDPWFDSTVIYMENFINKIFPAAKKIRKEIIVAQDGSGSHTTVQSALDEIPANNNKPVTIQIRNGLYKEKLHLDSTKDFVTLLGEDKFKTILSYDDHTGKLSPAGDTINTRTSWSFLLKANDFTAKNMTFQNDAGFTAGQAVAMEADGDRIVFDNCRFIGNQDVLFTNNDNSRQYYRDCYIQGSTDFIFGSATVWFERCHIYSKKNSHITAASTPADHYYGYVFYNCHLTGDTSLHNVSLGRPWRPYASVMYIKSYIGPHIKAEGWSNWNNTENYKTTRFSEYHNYGPGANPSGRVNWSNQLTDDIFMKTRPESVLGDWILRIK